MGRGERISQELLLGRAAHGQDDAQFQNALMRPGSLSREEVISLTRGRNDQQKEQLIKAWLKNILRVEEGERAEKELEELTDHIWRRWLKDSSIKKGDYLHLITKRAEGPLTKRWLRGCLIGVRAAVETVRSNTMSGGRNSFTEIEEENFEITRTAIEILQDRDLKRASIKDLGAVLLASAETNRPPVQILAHYANQDFFTHEEFVDDLINDLQEISPELELNPKQLKEVMELAAAERVIHERLDLPSAGRLGSATAISALARHLTQQGALKESVEDVLFTWRDQWVEAGTVKRAIWRVTNRVDLLKQHMKD